MAEFNLRIIILLIALNMSLYLIVEAGLVHRPRLYDELGPATADSNGFFNDVGDNSNHYEQQESNFYQPELSYFDGESGFRREKNNRRDIKRSKLNLHTNLNLPRYLRTAI